MRTNTLDQVGLRALLASDEEFNVSAVGANGCWHVCIYTDSGVRAFSAAHTEKLLEFKTLSEVELCLRELGIYQFEVDGSSFDSAGNPHLSVADQEYEAWFKAEVQEALDDPSPAIPHEEAMRLIRAELKLS